MPLYGYLSAVGAALVVSDLDANRCAWAAATYGATVAAPEEIHTQHVDVFAPAALGAVLNDATIPRLRCLVVCGGANNQLAEVRHEVGDGPSARGMTWAIAVRIPASGPC
jgi:leucine dehydrogenase